MTIQSQLNNDAISKLSTVSEEIKNANAFDANQMIYLVLQEFNNSKIAFDDMNRAQKAEFEANILSIFLHKNLGITAKLINNK
jgi:serine/threonine-protein kinase RIO1